MQIITISGNIGRDPEFRTTQQGDKVLSFSLGAQQGWGERASTNWFRCSVWGKRAESLNGKLFKGMRAFVSGEFSTSEYEGKLQLNVRVNDVDFVNRAPSGERQAPASASDHGSGAWGDDLDDNVPF